MIDPKADKEKKLTEAKRLAEEVTDHYQRCNEERAQAGRFYHNTKGVGQWREKDLGYLEKQGRQPRTVNVLRRKIDDMIGMHAEQQRKAVVRPVGGEDKFLAEVLGHICDRVAVQADLASAMARDLHNGYVKGEGDTSVDVVPSPTNPAHIAIEIDSVSPHEVGWDPGSDREDRSDAGYNTQSRWLTKSEFVREYPKHAKKWKLLASSSEDEYPGFMADQNQGGESDAWATDDYGQRKNYYYDRKKRRARIVRLEYKAPRKDTYAVTEQGAQKLSSWQVDAAREDQLGVWAGVRLTEVWAEDTHALEFCGVEVLYDSTEGDGGSPNPFDGFSLDPFVYATDSEERIPYGPVRQLIDPQEELNKGVVSATDHQVGQYKPGWIVEDGAVENPLKFQAEVNTTGSVATVEKGGLAQIQKRDVPQVSPAAIQRVESNLKFFEIVSGIGADMDRPQAMQEPATSVAIRYHKSQLGSTDARQRFDTHLKNIYRKIVDTVTRAMPDSQIEELLGNSQKYRVENGMVIDLESIQPGPQGMPGQPMQAGPPGMGGMQGMPGAPGQQPKMAAIRDLRALKCDIELDASTDNPTLRRLKVASWLELHQAGVPIPLAMIAEAATDSRAEKEQLKKYAEEQSAMQQQATMMQAQQADQNIQQTLSIEAGRVQEQGRHNRADEELKLQKLIAETGVDVATLVERADADEYKAVIDVFKTVQQRQAQRAQSQGRVLQ